MFTTSPTPTNAAKSRKQSLFTCKLDSYSLGIKPYRQECKANPVHPNVNNTQNHPNFNINTSILT